MSIILNDQSQKQISDMKVPEREQSGFWTSVASVAWSDVLFWSVVLKRVQMHHVSVGS